MDKKEKECRKEWFPSILFGLSMKIKERKYWIFVWIEEGKEKKRKDQVLIYQKNMEWSFKIF